MMAMLDDLKLVNVEKPNSRDPILVRRNKMISKIIEQIELITNPTTPNSITTQRRVVDEHTGELSIINVEKRVIPWWWTTKDGKTYLAVRYGTRTIELKKGKKAVLVESPNSLPDILRTIKEATENGELDNTLADAGFNLRKRFSL